ncbi:MAG: ATP-binding protein [Rhodocyclaceae bacterium]|nr:ATP-binding protein [Rhodocyclaceae bacterium]
MKRLPLDRHALIAAAIYLALGGAWISLSDWLLALTVSDSAALTTYQTYKGWAFVAVMALLAYALISRMGRQLTALRESERRLAEDEAAIHALNEELEQRVAERTLALEGANRELESFAYSVSHDLRAPLRALNGFAHLLEGDEDCKLNAASRQMIARIRANAEKMDVLIDDILEFSRTGSSEMKREKIDVRALAQTVAAELQSDYPAAQIDIGDLPVAVGDPPMLRQVWMNLIGNALKFSSRRAAPRIEIAAARDAEGSVVYSIRDNGAGFDMTYAARLFGVFQRMHRADDFPGTGAGLAIVKRIVERHGGRIWAEAVADEGATFRFTLPACVAADSAFGAAS